MTDPETSGTPFRLPCPSQSRKRMIATLVLVFVCGALVGHLATLFGHRYLSRFFRPDHEKIETMISGRIADDFDLSGEERERVKACLAAGQPKILAVFESVKQRMDVIRKNIAVDVAAVMPDEARKGRWNKTYQDYFPAPPQGGPPHGGPNGPPPHGPPPSKGQPPR